MKDKKKSSSGDKVMSVITIAMAAVLVFYFMSIQRDINIMEEQLLKAEYSVEHQRLVNQDLELILRDEEGYYDRTAREKLGYAHPTEHVFVDASGAK